MITAKGHNGTVTFDGVFVTINRTGLNARMSVGKGEKRIPISQVTATQWKEPGLMVNGYLSFTLPGGHEAQSRAGSATFDATRDENAVIVTRGQRKDFHALRAEIDQAIVERELRR